MARSLEPQPVAEVSEWSITDNLAFVPTSPCRVRQVAADHFVVEGKDGQRMNPTEQGKVYNALKGVRKYRAVHRNPDGSTEFYVIVKKAQPVTVAEEVIR